MTCGVYTRHVLYRDGCEPGCEDDLAELYGGSKTDVSGKSPSWTGGMMRSKVHS